MGKATFLTAEWKDLVMANYVVDPKILQPYIPYKTEPDLYNGKAYVSLVGFMFANTKILGFRIPFHINFEEVNLRFYVRYLQSGIWKRGTVFIKEIVPRAAISFVANNLYNEKYSTLLMKHFLHAGTEEISLGYHWKYKNKWNRLEATVSNTAHPMQTESEEAFIAEHYWGYSKYNPHTTYEYEVQHPQWNIFPVKSYVVDCDFTALYGNNFSVLQDRTPDSVLVAEGSPIKILHKTSLV
ncbi:MAG: DUF2071 domain-containing protein [Ferruginibacter sp.]